MIDEHALKPFCNEVQVQAAESVTLRLVLDFRAIDVLEGLMGRGMDELLAELLVPKPPHGLTVKLIWAMTRAHHAELSINQIAGFVYDPEYGPAAGSAIGDLLQRVFHLGEEGEQSSRPPRRSGGASRASSKSGSLQASVRATSGRKRRVRS
jgi:hypothetical protein